MSQTLLFMRISSIQLLPLFKAEKKSTCFGKFFLPLPRTQIVATCSKTEVNTHNLYFDIITKYKFQLYKRMERNQNSPKV